MLPRRLPRKPRREGVIRSPSHRAFVRSHECSVPGCDRQPIECAHVRKGTDAGVGMKPGDNWTISLCRGHHAEQHTHGEGWFAAWYKIDMKALAAEFWEKSPHGARKRRAA